MAKINVKRRTKPRTSGINFVSEFDIKPRIDYGRLEIRDDGGSQICFLRWSSARNLKESDFKEPMNAIWAAYQEGRLNEIRFYSSIQDLIRLGYRPDGDVESILKGIGSRIVIKSNHVPFRGPVSDPFKPMRNYRNPQSL